MKKLIIPIIVLFICACQPSDKVVLDNGLLRLTFDRANGSLVSMTDLSNGYEYLDTEAEPQRLWYINPLVKGDVIP